MKEDIEKITDVKELQRLYLELYEEVVKQDERIDKAIEYIEKSLHNNQPYYKYLFADENGEVQNLDKLLKILKGENNEL